MYLQDFESAGALTLDAAEKISWKTAEFDSKIILVVDQRRLLAHCLPLCWDELNIRTGTPISIAVEGGDERRTLVGMVDCFQEQALHSAHRRCGRMSVKLPFDEHVVTAER